MLRIQKILVPVDLHEMSMPIALQAATLARRFGAEIILIHVVVLPVYMDAGPELADRMVDWARTELDKYLSGELHGLAVRRILLEGDPAQGIVKTAQDEAVSLIVMPTHGYGLFRRFLLGSVAAKVLHDAQCPVWTGSHLAEAPGLRDISNVLCAIDLSPHSERTLAWAKDAAECFGASLGIVHATQPAEAGPWRDLLVSRVTQEIAALQSKSGTQAEVHVEAGDVANAVASVAGRTGAGLLVIGRSPLDSLHSGRLRTNAYAIIRESPCPVVSI